MTDNDMQRLWTDASDIASRLTEMRSIDTQAAYRNVRHKVRSNRLRRAAATMFSRACAATHHVHRHLILYVHPRPQPPFSHSNGGSDSSGRHYGTRYVARQLGSVAQFG